MPWDTNTQEHKSPFEKAIRQNSVLLLEKLIKEGRTLTDRDLLYAIEGHYDALKFLLQKGLNSNALDTSGKNLLYHVTDLQAFEIILQGIKNMDHQDHAGDTILHQLVRDYEKINNLDLIKLCLSRKPNLSLRNKAGQTVLLSVPVPQLKPVFDMHVLMPHHVSAFLMLIDTLIKAGCSIGEIDSGGNTLLHRVCQLMPVDEYLQTMIQELVKRGASIHAKNSHGVNILTQILTKIDIDRKERISDPLTYRPQPLSKGAAALFPDEERQSHADFQEDAVNES